MRDEDMIDVHVVGAGLWERESDREFDEALRVEAEDDLRREKERSATAASVNGEEQQSIEGHSSSQHASLALLFLFPPLGRHEMWTRVLDISTPGLYYC